MFDCLETHCDAASTASPKAVASRPTLDPQQLERRLAGRNWLRLNALSGQHAQLARAREIALYLDAETSYLQDGSLLIVGLSLIETLALTERFGADLSCSAGIAGQGSHP